MGRSAAFADIGYDAPVHHPKSPADRSPAAAALREMRRQLDHSRGQLTDGGRPGDDPFARRLLGDAYERLKSALAVYNLNAAALGVPAARVFLGDVELESPVDTSNLRIAASGSNRPVVPFAPKSEARRSIDGLEPARQAEIEQARAEFFAKGGAK